MFGGRNGQSEEVMTKNQQVGVRSSQPEQKLLGAEGREDRTPWRRQEGAEGEERRHVLYKLKDVHSNT